jgi:hypothetical protein
MWELNLRFFMGTDCKIADVVQVGDDGKLYPIDDKPILLPIFVARRALKKGERVSYPDDLCGKVAK